MAMIPKLIIHADLDEMVFQGRNQSYGAYVLRRSYHRATLRSFAIAVSAFTLLSFTPRVYQLFEKTEEVEGSGFQTSHQVTLGPPPDLKTKVELPQVQPVRAQVQARIVAFRVPDVVPDEQADPLTTIHDQDTLQTHRTGARDQAGDEGPISTTIEEGIFTNGGGGTEPELGIEEPPVTDFIVLEKQPEPVNMAEFQKEIGYPQLAALAGIDGIVAVRILIDKTGKYQKHVVLRSPSPILTKAVETHIAMLYFTPGIQAKKPISVWVNVPVRFTLKR